jgi:AcrR family transcriptional regulator
MEIGPLPGRRRDREGLIRRMGPSARERIVAAMWEHLRQASSTEFTYSDVAAWAGVTRQTVHANFASRADMLVAIADRARSELAPPELFDAVYEAPSALDALDRLVDLHIAWMPGIRNLAVAIEFERWNDPEIEKHFEQRPQGRRSLMRHVVTRLRAEGLLRPEWTVETATDLATTLLTPATTTELIDLRGWTVTELGTRLSDALRRLLIQTSSGEESP